MNTVRREFWYAAAWILVFSGESKGVLLTGRKLVQVAEFKTPLQEPSGISFSPRSNYLACASASGRLWLLRTATLEVIPEESLGPGGSFGWLGDDETLVCVGSLRSVRRWRIGKGSQRITPQGVGAFHSLATKPGSHVVALGEFAYLSLIDCDTSRLLWRTYAHDVAWVEGLAFSPNGRFIGTVGVSPPDEDGDEDGYVWSTDNGRMIRHIKGRLAQIALSNEAAYVLTRAGVLKVNIKTGSVQTGPRGQFSALSCSGPIVAVAERDGRVLVLSSDLQFIASSPRLTAVTGVALANDAQRLATVSASGVITLWSF